LATAIKPVIAVAKADRSVGEIINVGSNYEISIGETVQMIAEVMGVDVEIETDDIRLRPEKSEVERLWADNSKALKLLGWMPKYAGRDGLRKGLAKTAAWFMEPQNLKTYKTDIYNL
jgi:dTDP-glucose 4,6-dehydratase